MIWLVMISSHFGVISVPIDINVVSLLTQHSVDISVSLCMQKL